jgi:hypothetical protein
MKETNRWQFFEKNLHKRTLEIDFTSSQLPRPVEPDHVHALHSTVLSKLQYSTRAMEGIGVSARGQMGNAGL